MKAEELRIGNLYNQFGNITVVSCFTIKDLSAAPPSQLWCKPIPITEEWLRKFGFGRSEEDEMGHNTGNIGFYYDYHFGRLTIDTGSDDTIIPHIKYVHQLQNLYFALTGEELILMP